jgi:cephalosporin hydroxylase
VLRRRRALRRLAGPVEELLDARLDEYWHARSAGVLLDTYAGLPLVKFPEDLRLYEQLLWEMRADTVIEIGTFAGGSALWFRDRLRAQRAYGRTSAAPLVISIDVSTAQAAEGLRAADGAFADEITLLEADVTDPELPERVAALLGADRRALVVEDSAHVYETTLAALNGFARFVPPGGWFVVEDGVVDVERVRFPDWPVGVLPAIEDWLASAGGAAFRQRREAERYILTCHPGGWLQRVDEGGLSNSAPSVRL